MPEKMTPKVLARNLAASLAKERWEVAALEQCLVRRLPEAVRGHAGALARDVIDALPRPFAPDFGVVAAALRHARAFETVHATCAKSGLWPEPDLGAPVMQPIEVFAELDLPALATLKDLSDWLKLPPERLGYFTSLDKRCEAHGETAVNHYYYNLVPKRSGGLRLIEAPKPRLKAMQRQVMRQILARVPVHDAAFGFVKGRGVLDGAARHASEEVVVGFDLKDFFVSVPFARVYGLFRALGYPQGVARALSGLCMNVTPERALGRLEHEMGMRLRALHLPQGAPSSPALANLALHRLDRRLAGLARRLELAYSRYADDLTFSGDGLQAGAVLRAVPGIVADEGYRLAERKTRVMGRGQRQVVTGLTVNAHLNVQRSEFDRLKAVIHGAQGFDEPGVVARLLGRIAWVEAVNRARGGKLWRLLEARINRLEE